MPIISATEDMEMGRIVVPGQPEQNVHETPPQPMPGHGGMCLSPQLFREAQVGGPWSKSALAYIETLSQS
jgi:hypothetical protein